MKSVAEVYHQETKYNEQEMFRYQRALDFNQQPLPHKMYHTEKKIELGPYFPRIQGKSVTTLEETTAISSASNASTVLPLERKAISRLLYLTNGVTGIVRYPDGQSSILRAAPSAGGLYPTEIYLAVRNVMDMQDGIYNYQVLDHSMTLVWEGDYWPTLTKCCMEHEAIGHSHLLMILTAVYQRSTWRYADRGYRRLLLDTGHLLGNLMAYAPEEGFAPYPIAGFYDAALSSLLLLDPLEEGGLIVVALPQRDAMSTTLKINSAIPSQFSGVQLKDKIERALQLHMTSSILNGKESASNTPPKLSLSPKMHLPERETIAKEEVILSGAPLIWPHGVSETIQERRSTRRFTGEPYLQEELASILEYAYNPVVSEPAHFFTPSHLTTYLVVQKVMGLPAGVYRYNPQKKAVSCLKTGNFEEQTYHFCLGQALARDAAALVIHTAHFPTALDQYGNRAYRYLHMDAGHIGERINLAAIQMGLGVSGIGGFYDDEVNTLLGLSLDTIIVYITTLGRP